MWAAFPGLDGGGAVQRELAWAAYSALANVSFDEYRGLRVLGQGGSYRFIHGLDGAMGDLALFAEALLLVDRDVASETLAYAFATQHGSASTTIAPHDRAGQPEVVQVPGTSVLVTWTSSTSMYPLAPA